MKTLFQKTTIAMVTLLSVACASHSLAQTSQGMAAAPTARQILGLTEGDYVLDTARSYELSGGTDTAKKGVDNVCGDTTVKWTGVKPPVLMLDAQTFFSDFNKGDMHELERSVGETCKNVYNTTLVKGNIHSTISQTCSKSGQTTIVEDLKVDDVNLTYTYQRRIDGKPIVCVLKLK